MQGARLPAGVGRPGPAGARWGDRSAAIAGKEGLAWPYGPPVSEAKIAKSDGLVSANQVDFNDFVATWS
jgi:hypothetical protein